VKETSKENYPSPKPSFEKYKKKQEKLAQMLNEPGLTSPDLLTQTIKKGKVNFNRDKHMMKKLIEHKKEKLAF